VKVTPVPGSDKSSAAALAEWTTGRLFVSVSEPAVTEAIVSVSWLAVPGSISIVSPTANPAQLATLMTFGCGTVGVVGVLHGPTGRRRHPQPV
jgi:hypothetical protein